MVLSSEQFPEASVPIPLPPGLSDENLGDSPAGDQIRANRSTTGRVSQHVEEKKNILANIDVNSPSRIKKIFLEEPTRHSIRVTGTISITPTYSPLHLTDNYHVYHHSSWKALTLSDTIWTEESKL